MAHKTPADSEWGRFAADSVERAMLVGAGAHLGVSLRPRTLQLDDSRVEIEGIDAASTVIAQLVANTGSYKSTFRNKVMADLFKLVWLRTAVPTVTTAVLVISRQTTRALSGWVSRAAADMGITLLIWDDDGIAES